MRSVISAVRAQQWLGLSIAAIEAKRGVSSRVSEIFFVGSYQSSLASNSYSHPESTAKSNSATFFNSCGVRVTRDPDLALRHTDGAFEMAFGDANDDRDLYVAKDDDKRQSPFVGFY